MCGIAGIVNLSNQAQIKHDQLNKMISMLYHRGPDDYGFYIDDHIGLAHTRLSIIDINGGHQPITDHDAETTIIFNGEIFNYIELKDELIKRGVQFKTKTDTEVILKLYQVYDESFVEKLNGQFSIAIWDKKERKLVIARDRVGITPLFYSVANGKLIFSSEIKSLLTYTDIKAKLDLNSLDQLFTFWTPVASSTLFENIYEVKPGEIITVKNNEIIARQYWDWLYPDGSDNYYDHGRDERLIQEELHDKLVTSTKLRLRSDVPVGAYLSGGLDSSTLVSLIEHHSNVPLHTFSIYFSDKSLDESSYQQQMLKKLSAKHSDFKCSAKDIADNFERTIWHTETAILRSAPTPMMLLSGLVKDNGYKVVLTGEGADEVFGGYDLFKEGKIRKFWSKNKNSELRPLLLKKLYPYLDISSTNSLKYLQEFFGVGLDNPNLPYFSHMPRWRTTAKIKSFYSDDTKQKLNRDAVNSLQESLPDSINDWDSFNQAQYIEAKMLMAKYLLSSQGDRMLMANSVEGRFPFLDHNIIEFANKLSPKMKMKVLNEKYILKKSVSKYLPEDILKRHKQPYRSPDIPSFINKYTRPYVEELLSPECIKDYGYFNPKKVALFMKKVNKGRVLGYGDNMTFMAILSTQLLHKKFIEDFHDSASFYFDRTDSLNRKLKREIGFL